MRKVYLSFLGTNDYLPCNYLHKGFEPIENVRFVQEANVRCFCKDWQSSDRIIIFTTEESYNKNWGDNGHEAKGGLAACEGLQTRLNTIGILAQIERVSTPSGRSEEEIWDIFATVFRQLEEGDLLYLDITHAFRSLPMLAMVILSYAKVMRNITVQSISYGALEALGNMVEVKKLHIKDRNVPVFDLLPFDQLQDWVIAVDRFTATGDGKMIQQLAETYSAPIREITKGKDLGAVGLQRMGQCLNRFSSIIATCRGLEITASTSNLQDSLRNLHNQEIIKPLKPLLEKLEPALASFKGEEITDGLAAARWCLDHDLFQQGYTILQETIITHILKSAAGLDGRDKDHREIVLQAVTILINELPEDRWKKAAHKHKPTTLQIIEWLKPQDDLVKSMRNLSNIRNDLNHSGQNGSPMKPKSISDQLPVYLDQMDALIEQYRHRSAAGSYKEK